MGQSQAYKRRHPGRRSQISAQEYTGLTFRWIAAGRAEGEDSRGQAAGNKASQDRPHNSQGKDRQHRHSEAGQAKGRAQGQEGSRETQQARHTHHAQQAEPHGTQGKRGSRGTRQARGQAAGSTGQRTSILNMRHTETSNCAIVVAWQESERGRARQGSTPAHQLVERDSREAVSFVLLSDICGRRPPGQRGRA